MTTRHFSLAAAILVASTATAVAEAVILSQPDAPLEITRFKATYSSGSGSYPREGIEMRTSIKNKSNQAVTAYGLGFYAFDVFNEPLGRGLNGISLEAIDRDKEVTGAWAYQPLAAFKFERYGTGVAYVRQVRFADGTVWKADLSDVLRELQKIEDSLTLEDLSTVDK